jgi:hypothetical protein
VNDWTLELDVSGTRQSYKGQGTAQDARHTTSAYAGVLFRYSQANAQRFYLDDFTVTALGVPSISTAVIIDNRTVEVTFSEPVLPTDATNPANYRLNGAQVPLTADWSATVPQKVMLSFALEFTSGTNRLVVLRVSGAAGAVAQNLGITFDFGAVALPGDVRITEIYADLIPLQNLPNAEFIELYNRSNKTLNLQNWRYSDATTASGTFPSMLLRPGAYVIVCAATDTALFRPYGAVVGLTAFPSLNDSGDEVELFNASGQLMDFVRYATSWYREPAKATGGWSLELLDVNSRCVGASQWKASLDPKGGTPGQPNSVQSADREAPVLQHITATAPDKLLLQFQEPLDSSEAVQASKYTVSGGVMVQQVRLLSPALTQVELTLASDLQENERYTVTLVGVQDCAGNVAQAQQQAVRLPATPQPGDVVVNEILFNPRPGGEDFIEVVNRSSKYLNLQNWKLANRTNGEISGAQIISTELLLLAPGEFLVFTSDIGVLLSEYPAGHADRFIQMPSLPAYPDERGHVLLLLPSEAIMDEVSYESSQHFKLLADLEGISLERISLTSPSTASNFHSAASTVKATPGYENSQAQQTLDKDTGKLTLSAKTFTPDGDGVEDALLLQFLLPQPGYVATVSIFDAQGRPVRKLSGNTLLGTESVLQWDGLTDGGSKAAIGYYVVLVELADLQGKREVLKETVVVGGRL